MNNPATILRTAASALRYSLRQHRAAREEAKGRAIVRAVMEKHAAWGRERRVIDGESVAAGQVAGEAVVRQGQEATP